MQKGNAFMVKYVYRIYKYRILTGRPLLIWYNLLVSFIFAYTGCTSFLVTVVQNPRRLKIGSRRLPNLVANVMVVLRFCFVSLANCFRTQKCQKKLTIFVYFKMASSVTPIFYHSVIRLKYLFQNLRQMLL